MGDIEEIGCSLELPIGIRFHFRNQLHKVVEAGKDEYRYLKCAFYDKYWNNPMCQIMICGTNDRHDKKSIFFKEIKSVTD